VIPSGGWTYASVTSKLRETVFHGSKSQNNSAKCWVRTEQVFESDTGFMRIQDGILRLWQRVPMSWRTGLVKSSFAPQLRRVMNFLYPRGSDIFPLAAPLEGYRMRLEWRSSKAFVFGTYESEVTRALLQLVQTDWVVFDIGAHIGYFVLLLARLVGPHGRVFAFEPFPDNFRALKENVRMNDCRNVFLENRAVAATSGLVNLKLNDTNRLTYTPSLVDGRPMIDVEAVSVDDYMVGLQERVQFVMMDVEGAEAAVLKGMRSVLQRDFPTLLIELHGFDHWGQSHPALQELHCMDYTFRYLEAPGAQVHILAEHRIAKADDGGSVC
jgi:FkbM family methyltransferase